MDRPKRSICKKVNFEQLSDDQLVEYLHSTESDDDEYDYGSDDSAADPDYTDDKIEFDDNIEFDDKIEPDDERALDHCIEQMNEAENTNAFVEAINFSLNITEPININDAIASSTLLLENLREIEEVEVEVEVQPRPSTSNAFKSNKRNRSPLPTIEIGGPTVRPYNGGFNLQGNLSYFCK